MIVFIVIRVDHTTNEKSIVGVYRDRQTAQDSADDLVDHRSDSNVLGGVCDCEYSVEAHIVKGRGIR